MRRNFIETKNIKRLKAGLVEVAERGAPEARIVLVEGGVGLGKTEALRNIQKRIDPPGVYVRAVANWTPRWMLRDIARGLRVPVNAATCQAHFDAVSAGLIEFGRTLLIDEFDQVARSMKLVETLRDLADTTETAIVVAGAPGIENALGRARQVHSRVASVVRFRPMVLEDIYALAEACTDEGMKVHKNCAARLREGCEGSIRLLLSHLGRAEGRAKEAKRDVITLDDLDQGRSGFQLNPVQKEARA